MLSINFSKVKNSSSQLTRVERKVELSSDFFKRSQKMLYDAKNVHVAANLFFDEPYVTGNYRVTADLIVPSSRSLKPVAYHEDFTFTENYSLSNPNRQELAESEAAIVKVKDDVIDLQTAIEDNLLLQIPTTILTPKEKKEHLYPAGQGWAVVSEHSFKEGKKNQVNPAFAKLKVLLAAKNKDHKQNK